MSSEEEDGEMMTFALEYRAKRGNIDAAIQLIDMYENGVGVKRNVPKADYWAGIANKLTENDCKSKERKEYIVYVG